MGWTVTTGVHAFEGNGVEAAEANGTRAHDAVHPVFVLTSPPISFANVSAVDAVLDVIWEGGQGNQGGSPDPLNLAEVTSYNGGTTDGNGQKGLALRNLGTGNYDFVSYDSANGGGVETLSYTRADLVAGGVDPNANYVLDFYTTDSGGWGWTRLDQVNLDAEAQVPVEPGPIIFWDFNDGVGGDHGWKTENGFSNFVADGVHASQNGTDFAEDNSHETLIFRSPRVNFNGANEVAAVIEVDFIGGRGNQSGSPDPADPAAVLAYNGGNSNSNGQKGLAFLNLTTGNYDHVVYDSADGGDNPETISLTKAELIAAGIDISEDYRLDFYEHDDGAAGWTRLESVNVDALVFPDPPPPPPPPPPGGTDITWDFSTGDLQGWTVTSGVHAFEGAGIEAAEANGTRAHDAAHPVFVLTSPPVSFRSSSPTATVVEIDWEGGQGNQSGSPDPVDLAEVLAYNGGTTDGNGQKGLGFRNLTTGEYDFVSYDSANGGGVETLVYTRDDLVANGIDPDANYELDFYTTDSGGWGWTRLDEVRLDAIINPGPTSVPQLRIARNVGNLDIAWDSQAGMLYNLRSETDPSNGEPKDWPIYDGKMDIVATPDTNTLTIPLPPDLSRFFVIEEFPAPPVTVFSDDFESGVGDWTAVVNDANGNTQWELGTPVGSTGPDSGADGSANAWCTNLGDYGPDSDISLRSPPIDLSVVATAELTFEAYRDADGVEDTCVVRFLRASDLVQLGADTAIDMSIIDFDYESLTIPVVPEALGGNVIIEFKFVSDGSFESFSGLSIDNVVVAD